MNRHALVVTILISLLLAFVAGCGPRMITVEEDLKARRDEALIVFLRPNPLAFGRAEFSLWDRDKLIGLIEPVTSVSYRAKPGIHTFMAKAENWEVVKGKVAAGKTYYFWIDPGVGILGARVNMSVLDPNDRRIKEWMKNCRPIALANPAKAGSFEKKYEREVAEALGNIDAGKANVTKLSASQGRGGMPSL